MSSPWVEAEHEGVLRVARVASRDRVEVQGAGLHLVLTADQAVTQLKARRSDGVPVRARDQAGCDRAWEHPPPGRLHRWLHYRAFDGAGLLVVYEQKSAKRIAECAYIVTEAPSDEGRHFVLTKVGGHGDPDSPRYDVLVRADLGHRCPCKAHEHRGWCRHVNALAKLCADGTLPPGALTPRGKKKRGTAAAQPETQAPAAGR